MERTAAILAAHCVERHHQLSVQFCRGAVAGPLQIPEPRSGMTQYMEDFGDVGAHHGARQPHGPRILRRPPRIEHVCESGNTYRQEVSLWWQGRIAMLRQPRIVGMHRSRAGPRR